MTVRGVDDDEVDAGLDEGHRALEGVLTDADRGADDEPSLASFVASGYSCSSRSP